MDRHDAENLASRLAVRLIIANQICWKKRQSNLLSRQRDSIDINVG